MTYGDDALPAVSASDAPVAPPHASDAPADTVPPPGDDRMTRRSALRDLAAMIGVEVFY